MPFFRARVVIPLAVAAVAACQSPDPGADPAAEPTGDGPAPVVHVHSAGAEGIFANAYLVETEQSVVAVDALLTVPDAMALRARVDELGKPLRAVLLTHGHPDHYNGVRVLVGDDEVPVYSTPGVSRVIERDDAAKEAQWRPMFGDAWPAERRFPDRLVADGEAVEIDGVRFVVRDVGPAESDHDSFWLLEGESRAAFVGDLVFNEVHAYLADGNTGPWLDVLDRMEAELAGVEVLYPGHGDSGGLELIDAQRSYLRHYRTRVAELAAGRPSLTEEATAQLVEEMKSFWPTDRLEFLIGLGADPVAAELAAGN